MRRAILLLVVFAGCSAPPSAPPIEFWAGVAAVEITPTRNVPLGGYGARKGQPMTGVHDPIFAKALWLETPQTRICLVTTDLIGSLVSLRDRIRPSDAAVILTASHSHSAGPTGMVLPGEYDDASDLVKSLAYEKSSCADAAFLARVEKGIVEAVVEADAHRAPGAPHPNPLPWGEGIGRAPFGGWGCPLSCISAGPGVWGCLPPK